MMPMAFMASGGDDCVNLALSSHIDPFCRLIEDQDAGSRIEILAEDNFMLIPTAQVFDRLAEACGSD